MAAPKKPLEISVACAARLEARVECVLEALGSRGHRATLHTGADAREALLAADARSLRVLLLADRLDPAQLETLERGLDPERRGNLLVTTIDRSAPEMAERIEAFARVAIHKPKRAHSFKLPDPVAPTVKPRAWVVPLAIAAVVAGGLLVALQYGLRRDMAAAVEDAGVVGATARPQVEAEPEVVEDASPSAPIEVSVQPADDGIEIFEIEGTRARTKRARKPAAPTTDESVHAPATADPVRPIPEAPALGVPAPVGIDFGPVAPARARDERIPPGEEHSLE